MNTKQVRRIEKNTYRSEELKLEKLSRLATLKYKNNPSRILLIGDKEERGPIPKGVLKDYKSTLEQRRNISGSKTYKEKPESAVLTGVASLSSTILTGVACSVQKPRFKLSILRESPASRESTLGKYVGIVFKKQDKGINKTHVGMDAETPRNGD